MASVQRRTTSPNHPPSQQRGHSAAGSSSHRTHTLTVESLCAKFGERLVRSAARLHGAKFSELRPEGTLKSLQGMHASIAAAGGTPSSKRRTHSSNGKRRGSSSGSQERGARGGGSGSDDESADSRSRGSTSPFSAAHHRPLTEDEFTDAKRSAAWGVAEEECQRLLAAVHQECIKLLQDETDHDAAAAKEEHRLEHLKHAHEERMSREQGQFAERLKKSIEGTRAVMQRIKEEGEASVRRFHEDQQREEEDKQAAYEALRKWQKESRQRADEQQRMLKERERQRQEERRLQHWREYQAEQHQKEVQESAEQHRRQQLGKKQAAGSKRFDNAISVRQKERERAHDFKMECAVDKLHYLEEQERNAHQRWRTYQNYKKMRSVETSNHVNEVKERAKQIEEDRLRAADEKRREQEHRMQQWKRNFTHHRKEQRHQFDHERRYEQEALKRARLAEDDRKERAAITLQWLNDRSQQQLDILDQRRAVKQYEQHVVNAAMKRRADRAKQARDLRNSQVQAEWNQKMEQGDQRSKQREEMSKRSRLEKERLAVLAQRMRWRASTGQSVDMAPIDNVLRNLEGEEHHHHHDHHHSRKATPPARTSSAQRE